MSAHAIFLKEPYVPLYVERHEQEADGIVSFYKREPMNVRCYDWKAHLAGDPHKREGHGETREDAIEDLKSILELPV